jgi:HK97 gp10 family phage protein
MNRTGNAMISVDVKGVKELAEAFDKFELEAKEEILKAMKPLAEEVATKARTNAPKRTGKGAASIRTNTGITKHGNPFGTVICGDDETYYMQFQEYGTSKIKPIAFMRGAADSMRNQIVEKLKEVMRRVKWL